MGGSGRSDTMDKVSFDFTKTEYQHICEEAMLNDIQKKLLDDKIKGLTLIEMSFKHNISPETAKRHIQKIKKKILKII